LKTVFLCLATMLVGCGQKDNAPTDEKAVVVTKNVWDGPEISLMCVGREGDDVDLFCRAVSKEMAADLGVSIEVVTGDSYRLAVSALSNRVALAPLLLLGVEDTFVMGEPAGEEGFAPTNFSFHVIAESPGVISVPSKSRHTKIQGLVREAKREGSSVSISAGKSGGVWHAKMLGLGDAADVSFKFTPTFDDDGSVAAAYGGQSAAAVGSLASQAKYIIRGDMKPLGMLDGTGHTLADVGTIDPVSDLYPDLENDGVTPFVAIVVEKKQPEALRQRIGEAFQTAVESEGVKQLIKEKYWHRVGQWGAKTDQGIVAGAKRRIEYLEAGE